MFKPEFKAKVALDTLRVDKTLVDILTTNNSRGIVFLEAPAWKKGKGGTNSDGDYCDPWSSNNLYAIALDTNYDNLVRVSTNGAASGSYDIMKKVGVWSVYPTNSKYQVRSWD